MYDLTRFHHAQESAYPRALAEIRAGRKTSHWIWYIFPQISGLGRSNTAVFYSIRDLGEARAYLDDPILGPRLREITQVLLDQPCRDMAQVMGSRIDMLKLRSSMTLFEAAAPEEQVFSQVLDTFYRGERDQNTLRLLHHK